MYYAMVRKKAQVGYPGGSPPIFPVGETVDCVKNIVFSPQCYIHCSLNLYTTFAGWATCFYSGVASCYFSLFGASTPSLSFRMRLVYAKFRKKV